LLIKEADEITRIHAASRKAMEIKIGK